MWRVVSFHAEVGGVGASSAARSLLISLIAFPPLSLLVCQHDCAQL